jgi:hypothetical protein
MKSITVQKNADKDADELSLYEVLIQEDRLLVHRQTFVDPEFAIYYAEQYMLNVWKCSEIPAITSMSWSIH